MTVQPGLSADELLFWNDATAQRWRQLLGQHPEALAVACDIREGCTVADLLQHIVAAELRYAERLADEPVTEYGDISKDSVEALFAVHDVATGKLRGLLADAGVDWEGKLEFATRSAGTLVATRRTILIHSQMHSIRHYAQLATLLRQQGIAANWMMDFLAVPFLMATPPGA